MSGEKDRWTESLVRSAGGEIVRKSTSLASRGLSHLKREKPATTLQVVIGDHENNIGPFLIKMIEKSGEYEVVPVVIRDTDSLVRHAKQENVDLFVLIVNNLSCYASNPHLIPDVLATLKAIRPTPIIALSGDYQMSSESIESILRAGADVLLWMPVFQDDFGEAVRNVLSRRAANGKVLTQGQATP